MKKFENKTVWITGASSGIGEATAYRFAQEGARLILTALEADLLDEVAKKCKKLGSPNVAVMPFDLSQTDGVEALAIGAWAAFGHIDILYNNAGISQRGTTVETEMKVIRKVMDIDFYAPVIITKTILPLMLERGGGQLVVTTSIAGRFGFPMRCAYTSAKHALYGFFETVQAEYYDKGIRVTIVCPGRVATNISVSALEKDGTRHGKMDAGQANGLDVSKAADKIVKAVYRKRREVLVGRKELLMVQIKRFFPGLCARIARRIQPM
ncbi:MAG: SDR family oxidoreductase [Bacteroidales bacterium]|nr:SDR family oxidoreductase [Bacteroidales bacterium]